MSSCELRCSLCEPTEFIKRASSSVGQYVAGMQKYQSGVSGCQRGNLDTSGRTQETRLRHLTHEPEFVIIVTLRKEISNWLNLEGQLKQIT